MTEEFRAGRTAVPAQAGTSGHLAPGWAEVPAFAGTTSYPAIPRSAFCSSIRSRNAGSSGPRIATSRLAVAHTWR